MSPHPPTNLSPWSVIPSNYMPPALYCSSTAENDLAFVAKQQLKFKPYLFFWFAYMFSSHSHQTLTQTKGLSGSFEGHTTFSFLLGWSFNSTSAGICFFFFTEINHRARVKWSSTVRVSSDTVKRCRYGFDNFTARTTMPALFQLKSVHCRGEQIACSSTFSS